jgi:hypothetical protein
VRGLRQGHVADQDIRDAPSRRKAELGDREGAS